jgi:DNA-binding NtrC family response regulator
MKETIRALLLHDKEYPLRDLRPALESLSVKTTRAKTCQDALTRLKHPNPPHLVFTDVEVSGTPWKEVIGLTSKASAAVDVIVVSRDVDTGLYISTIESGAFDFIVPPFEKNGLVHVVKTAASDVLERRTESQQPAWAL